MKMPYLGRIDLFWCYSCNVPVLGIECGNCKRETQKVKITPPGDVRPAFDKDIEIINRCVENQFGTLLLDEKEVVLLNSVAGHDRFDEIILDGQVVGALRYDVIGLDYEFMPRIEGVKRFWKKGCRGFVSVAQDAAEFVKQGKSVLMPGVIDFDIDIKEGQQVVVVCEDQVIAVGKARFSGEVAANMRRGMFVKVRRRVKDRQKPRIVKRQNWDAVVKANREVLERIESEARGFIKMVIGKNKLPVVVSFSGGKDSLATLLLVRKIVETDVLFIDTGVEFPETLSYVEELAGLLGLRLIRVSAGEKFWGGLKIFGMSGRDYRWCCKVCKMGPVAKVIEEQFPSGFLNFIGQRRFESEVRSKSRRVWRNTWLPKQLSASPIQNWNALHIWLFLLKEGVKSNPLYGMGFERIGCWLCPSASLSEIAMFKELHPHLWEQFERRLVSSGYGYEEIEHGFWRWKKIPKGQTALGLDFSVRESSSPVFKVDDERAANLALSLGKAVSRDIELRSSLCLECGVCLSQCYHSAIEFQGNKVWINQNCRGCGKCHKRCPIVKFLYNEKYN